ncbi:hypothetical protein M419DRAFT_126756 [Trichoderma reesei RUT C-30]|uniref:Uncharacterized protein n=1 Tax=Hypocrea jecorina (strain ATCC 56765 / BCRC 32924 / NRRL 11460 / Rut C-30) TaxID=1344414 RepID=A0A024SI61_HYPJR|nr:hypothetical protein M419DRAFT_126756 [Trichoderma reesei RUT C-30]
MAVHLSSDFNVYICDTGGMVLVSQKKQQHKKNGIYRTRGYDLYCVKGPVVRYEHNDRAVW